MYVQNIVLIGMVLTFEEFLIIEGTQKTFPTDYLPAIFSLDVGLDDFIFLSLIAFITLYRFIRNRVHESLIKTYRSDYKEQEKKGIVGSELTRYNIKNIGERYGTEIYGNEPGFEEGKLKEGKFDGVWFIYNEVGGLLFEVTYNNGKTIRLKEYYPRWAGLKLASDVNFVTKESKYWDLEGNLTDLEGKIENN